MLLYTLHFESPDGNAPSEALTFKAETEQRAKLKAAMLHAGASSWPVPSAAYCLLGPSRELVYRYPEE
jgi:hypothetical protein